MMFFEVPSSSANHDFPVSFKINFCSEMLLKYLMLFEQTSSYR
jgi:hypothetical protein